MLIQITLCGLVILLIAVITISYYVNKEGFEAISSNNIPNATSCHGWDCSIENQMCIPPAPGTGDTTYICKNKKWVNYDSINKPSSAPVPAPVPAPVISSSILPHNTQETPVSSTTPQRNDIVPEVSLSESGYNAMKLQQKNDLLKDIQKVVRNEILANRMTTPMLKEKEKNHSDDSEESDCTMQGKEYESRSQKNNGEEDYRCPKNPDGSCPPIPDMTQYIKKDAIPCWGCSIQY